MIASSLALLLAAESATALSMDIMLDAVARTPPSQSIGWQSAQSLAMSADGRFIVHSTTSQHLFEGQLDRPGTLDLFVYDRQAGIHQLVSHVAGAPNQACAQYSVATGRSISADGRWIAYESDCPNPGSRNVYLYDRESRSSRLVSKIPGSGLAAGSSKLVEMSADGRWVLFGTAAQSIAPGSSFGAQALFLVDRDDPAGNLQPVVARSNDQVFAPSSMSADGRYIAFSSAVPNLDPAVPDNDQDPEIFLFDRITSATRMVTRVPGQNLPGRSTSANKAKVLSGDGSAVFYAGAIGAQSGMLVYDRAQDQHTLLIATPTSSPFAASQNGDRLLYINFGSGGELRLVDRSGDNVLVDQGPLPDIRANGRSYPLGLSADGNRVLFISEATDLVPGVLDANGRTDVFMFELASNARRLLSASAADQLQTANGASGHSLQSAMSVDGEWVALPSTASDLTAGVTDANSGSDLFVTSSTQLQAQLLTQIPVPVEQTTFNGTRVGDISPNGRWITFERYDTGLKLRDLLSGNEWLVGRSHLSPTQSANSACSPLGLSADGRWVWFASNATDLVENFVPVPVPGSTGPVLIYQFDRATGSVTLLTHRTGLPAAGLASDAFLGGVSDDGRWTLFTTRPQGLVSGVAADAPMQVFLYDKDTRSTRLLSHAAGAPGTIGNGESKALGLSKDGRRVLYLSTATNLVAEMVDVNGGSDVFLFNRDSGASTLVSFEAGASLRTANAPSQQAVLSSDGNMVVLQSLATNLVSGLVDNNQGSDLFRFLLSTGQITLISHQTGQSLRTANAASELVEVQFLPRARPRVRSLSSDGSRLLVRTLATDLIDGVDDANASQDVYQLDLDTQMRRDESGRTLEGQFLYSTRTSEPTRHRVMGRSRQRSG